LKSLALIDTPGMLDSITERDRGYNYQEVIGDLAQIADLVLVVFDPHKAGTVREAYISIRETLPGYIFEHQLLFVLNRIDECTSLTDLLRVYGTLCWNLSQITGRKDIPMIHLTYSPRATFYNKSRNEEMQYINYLENQREELKKAILEAPRHRLDHLASFVETHGERLTHMLEALVNYRKRLISFRFKCGFTGFLISLLCGGIAFFAMLASPVFAVNQPTLLAVGGGVALASFFFWLTVPLKYFGSKFHRSQLKGLDDLTTLENQTRRDTWEIVRNMVHDFIKKTEGRFSFREAKREYFIVSQVCDKGSKDIREALNELARMGDKGFSGDVEFPFSRKIERQDDKEKTEDK